jgi:hypothetical protein
MAYIPKSPPSSPREKVAAGSLLSKIPVTSVTEVTPTRIGRPNEVIQVQDLSRTSASGASGPDAPIVSSSGGMTGQLGQWLRASCIVSSCCVSSAHTLYRQFAAWAVFALSVEGERAFLDALRLCGFVVDEFGMLGGLVLAEDFIAALELEKARGGFPARSRDLKGGNTQAMIIRAKQKNFEIPDEGEHLAVLADVIDLGLQETPYGLKDRI